MEKISHLRFENLQKFQITLQESVGVKVMDIPEWYRIGNQDIEKLLKLLEHNGLPIAESDDSVYSHTDIVFDKIQSMVNELTGKSITESDDINKTFGWNKRVLWQNIKNQLGFKVKGVMPTSIGAFFFAFFLRPISYSLIYLTPFTLIFGLYKNAFTAIVFYIAFVSLFAIYIYRTLQDIIGSKIPYCSFKELTESIIAHNYIKLYSTPISRNDLVRIIKTLLIEYSDDIYAKDSTGKLKRQSVIHIPFTRDFLGRKTYRTYFYDSIENTTTFAQNPHDL